MIDRRYLRGAKDMREAVARVLEADGQHASAGLVRTLAPAVTHEIMSRDSAWARRMAEEDVEHQRAGWRERTERYQAKKKSRGAVKSACTPTRSGA